MAAGNLVLLGLFIANQFVPGILLAAPLFPALLIYAIIMKKRFHSATKYGNLLALEQSTDEMSRFSL